MEFLILSNNEEKAQSEETVRQSYVTQRTVSCQPTYCSDGESTCDAMHERGARIIEVTVLTFKSLHAMAPNMKQSMTARCATIHHLNI